MDLIIEDMARISKGDTFGGRLTEAREEAERWDGKGYGYTQGELADLLARDYEVTIGRSYLSELERSWQQNKMPSLEVAAALAQALNVNLNWLVGLSTNKEPEDADADLAWSPTTNAIANTLDGWPETARQMLLASVRAMNPYFEIDKEDDPDAGSTIADAEAQEKLNSLLSSRGTNSENGEQPQARRKRKAAGR